MIFKVAFRNLFRNVRRSIAILLTVAFGSAALFLFQGFIHGVLSQFKENSVHTQFGHAQINVKGYRDARYEEPWKHWINDRGELERELSEKKEVSHTFPRVSFGALLKHKKSSISGYGQGIDAVKENEFFHSLNFIEGENLSTQANGIVLGKGLADALNVHVGDQVQVYAQSVKGSFGKGKCTVVGIFHTGSSEFDGRTFRIQLAQAQSILRTQNLEQITLGLHDEHAFGNLKKDIEEKFPYLEATYFEDLDKIYYKHSVDWLNSQYTIVQGIILSIVLLGIFNTISSAILERRQEIGNLRANGESKKDIISLVLTEGAILGAFGVAFGIAVSYLFSTIVFAQGVMMPPGPGSTRQFAVQFAFTPAMIIQTIGLSLLSCLVASFFAGQKVSRLTISQSLRD